MNENLRGMGDVEWWGVWAPGENGKPGGWIQTVEGELYWGPRVVMEVYAHNFKRSWPLCFAKRFAQEQPAPQQVADPSPTDDDGSRFRW